MDHWIRFYLLLVDPGHTTLGSGGKKKARIVSHCMCQCKQMSLNPLDLLLYCPTNATCVLSMQTAACLSLKTQTPDVPFLESDFDTDSVGQLPSSNCTVLNSIHHSPVMLILADHLEVPSSTLCLICFIWVTWVDLGTANTSWISSKISGLFLSRIFMRSLRTMMMFWVRSSAPCFELFSAAPG